MSKQEQEDTFASDAVAFVCSSILAVWAVYTTFIIMGGMLANVFEEREDLRLALALVLALIIPVVTAMGANSRKEGAEGIQRLTRVNIGATIFSFGCAVIVAIALPDRVVTELAHNPNWFMDNPDSSSGAPDLNRRYSHIISNMTCRGADAAGTYYCPDDIKM